MKIMPPYVFYLSLVVGMATTIVVSLIMSKKFDSLNWLRKLTVAVAGFVYSVVCTALSAAVTGLVFEYIGWRLYEETATMLLPTTRYLWCMYALETIIITGAIAALISTMANSQHRPNARPYLRR